MVYKNMRNKETHNALELLLTAQLFLDIFDNYELKKELKRTTVKCFTKHQKKKTIKHNEVYKMILNLH